MYSVVMMMALSGAAEAPECGRLFHGHGCHGCYGCSCSCYGGYGCSCYGCYGCSGCTGYVSGGCHGCHGYRNYCNGGCYGCYGCYGCSGCFGYGYYNVAPMVNPNPPPMPKPDLPNPKPGSVRAPATIQVNIPSEAVIYFDGFKTTVNGKRRYTTPVLEQGKTYFYNVKVEITHEGQTVTTTQRVIVRAGAEAQLSVDMTPAGILTARQD